MTQRLFADDPIDDPKQDKLGRIHFADQVAQVCKNVTLESSSSVIALVGPWGAGKSSILELAKDKFEKEGWLVAEFNPWLLSDLEGLMTNFFGEVVSVLPKSKRNKDDLRKTFAKYGSRLTPLGSLASLAGIGGGDKIAQKFVDLIAGDQSLSAQRKKLAVKLVELDKPIFVIMDDLDRLHPDELMLVFKLVRLVGRLPNMYYVLCYDEETLLDVITQTDIARGENNGRARAQSYLEKIVQVRLDLPVMTEDQQGKLTDTAIDEVLARCKIPKLEEIQVNKIARAYQECLKLYLTHPRAIKRYLAQVQALFPLVQGEVDFADFLLLTFLRTFEPEVYHLVVESQKELTGRVDAFSDRADENNQQRSQRWHDDLAKITKRPDEIFNLLSVMFVPLKSARHNTNYGDGAYREVTEHKGVGSKDYFERYFVFGVGSSDVSDAELAANLEKLGGRGGVSAKRKIKKELEGNPPLVLRKLNIANDHNKLPAKPIIELLGEVYGKLKHERGMFSDYRPNWMIDGLVGKLFGKVPSADLVATAETLCSSESGLELALSVYTGEENATKRWRRTVKATISNALTVKLRELKDKPLEQITDKQFSLLYYFRMIHGTPALKSWVAERLESGNWSLLDTAARLVSTATRYSDTVSEVIGDVSNETLDDFIGIDRLLDELSTQIESFRPPSNLEIRSASPTAANKKKFVLARLQHIKQLREPASDEDSTEASNP